MLGIISASLTDHRIHILAMKLKRWSRIVENSRDRKCTMKNNGGLWEEASVEFAFIVKWCTTQASINSFLFITAKIGPFLHIPKPLMDMAIIPWIWHTMFRASKPHIPNPHWFSSSNPYSVVWGVYNLIQQTVSVLLVLHCHSLLEGLVAAMWLCPERMGLLLLL